MLRRCYGDILAAQAEALVCPVNCVGVMGAGLARQVRDRYPSVYRAYQAACRQHTLRPGRVLVLPTGTTASVGFAWVVAVPTKRHWRDPARLDDLDAGLAALAATLRAGPITSVAVPALGCGRGGLDWTTVAPRVHAALTDLDDVTVLVYEPYAGRPHEQRLAETLPLLGPVTDQVAVALTWIGPCEHLCDGGRLRWPPAPVTPDDALATAEQLGEISRHIFSVYPQLHGMPEQLAARLLTEWTEAFAALKRYVGGTGELVQVTGQLQPCARTATWISSGQAHRDLRSFWPPG